MRRLLLPAALLGLALAACGEETPTRTADRPAPPPVLEGSPDGTAVDIQELPPLPSLPPEDVPGTHAEGAAEAPPAARSGAGVPAAPVPDTLAAFHARMQALVAACRGSDEAAGRANARDLLLPAPRAWFAHALGSTHPRLEALVAEYATLDPEVAVLPVLVRRQLEAGNDALLAEGFIDPRDERATGFQAVALRQMKHPITLYSLRLLPEAGEGGWHMWSFAHVDGHFRFVGQMLALAEGDPGDEALHDLGSMRIRDARALLEQDR